MFWLYAGFVLLILAALALDLLVIHKRAHVIRVREALFWTGVWVAVALAFSGAIFLLYENHVCGLGICAPSSIGGGQAALQYVSGYLIEKSLSIDNIFVIALIFAHFRVPARLPAPRAVLGRAGRAGAARPDDRRRGRAVRRASPGWSTSSAACCCSPPSRCGWTAAPRRSTRTRTCWCAWCAASTRSPPSTTARSFFTRLADGARAATPLFLVLLTVEVTDLIFARGLDPGRLRRDADPFLVFTSNVFAILGLRSLFFAVHDLMSRLHYMKPCLVVLLAFIGVKMVLTHHVKIPTGLSLGIIAGILGAGVVASLLHGRDEGPSSAP